MSPQQYDEAEKAYQDVLKYDSNNEDATKELYKCHTLQLMVSPSYPSTLDSDTTIYITVIVLPGNICIFRDLIYMIISPLLFQRIRVLRGKGSL